ncbi:MAG: hypothetical protein ACTSW4_01235 [Candidatus Ranarchaeia archaeon]
MVSKHTVLITGGAGTVGVHAVNSLSRVKGVQQVVIGDINEERGYWVSNSSEIRSLIHRSWVPVDYNKIDLLDVDRTAKYLAELEPTGIIHTGTLLSSYFYVPLIRKAIQTMSFPTVGRQAGHTFAKDFVLIHHLMMAVKQSGIKTCVANISFPDYTDYVLSKINLAPRVGGGTIDLTVEGMRKTLAKQRNIPPDAIQILMVANHALRSVPPEDFPHFVRIAIEGQDVTQEINTSELIKTAVKATAHRFNANITAASGVCNLLGILNDTGEVRHSPGVAGLPGGVPVKLTAQGAQPLIPTPLSKADVVKMNNAGMKPDGIEKITDDGTVIFTATCIRLMEEILDIHWTQVKVDQTLEMAHDLVSAYQRLSKKQ